VTEVLLLGLGAIAVLWLVYCFMQWAMSDDMFFDGGWEEEEEDDEHTREEQ
jgi:hypothetical protein